MRTWIRRYGLGSALCALGIALVLAGTAASLAHEAGFVRRAAPASTHTTLEEGGLALDAALALDAPLDVPLAPVRLHSSPAALDALPLPDVDVQRSVDLTQADIGLAAELALRSGAERSTQQRGGEGVDVASARAALVPGGAPVAVAAAALTAAGVLAYFWASVKSAAARVVVLPFLALYAKITRAEVFDNGVRERIFGAIRANPGVSASDLARLAGVSWGTTIYHLDVLEQTRMVSSIRNGRYRRYFENGAHLAVTKEAVAVLQNPVTASVVQTLRERPGASQKELAAATSMTPQALHWHLTRLVATGLVRKEREGRVVRHFAAN